MANIILLLICTDISLKTHNSQATVKILAGRAPSKVFPIVGTKAAWAVGCRKPVGGDLQEQKSYQIWRAQRK